VTPESRPHNQEEKYWTDDIALCSGTFYGAEQEQTTVRARIHASDERYRRGDLDREIETLQTIQGTRSYIHLQPYILEPEYEATIALTGSSKGNRVGHVMRSRWSGMRHREIGQVQAWHYPADRLTVLWECFYERPYRAPHLVDDSNMASLWHGVESYFAAHFPATERLVTPHRDPEFVDAEYEAFLHGRGYRRSARAAFGKVVMSK